MRHTVRNDQDQPLELHLSGGVLVLLPGQTADLSEAELAVPQLQVLCATRQITRHNLSATSSISEPEEAGGETANNSDDGADTAEEPRGEHKKALRRSANKDRT